ncbi:MAG TPA: ABC transporter [Candidatus Korarchaeota archaeon]|nr:ABC transporter [Candidatus Korarchaeota archaeon]
MWYRQIKRFLRARSRVIGSIVQPIFWLIFFGLGFSGSFRTVPGGINRNLDYLPFLVPGVVMMSVFFGSFMSGISVIWDREFGFLKEVLVAPVPRDATILGRALGDSTTSVIRGILILLLASVLAPSINLAGIPVALVSMILVALSFTSFGIIIGSKMRSMEGFQLINTFLSMPILFLSGAFYPVQTMPTWMRAIAMINPLTYGVDAARIALTGTGVNSLMVDMIMLLVTSVIFISISAWVFRRTTIE